jgi:hypothetical protein
MPAVCGFCSDSLVLARYAPPGPDPVVVYEKLQATELGELEMVFAQPGLGVE